VFPLQVKVQPTCISVGVGSATAITFLVKSVNSEHSLLLGSYPLLPHSTALQCSREETSRILKTILF